jgi:hypothetical protein
MLLMKLLAATMRDLTPRLVLAAALLLWCGAASADNAAVLTLPQPPAPKAKIPPWHIQVDPSGVEGQAYRGVKITVAVDPRNGPTTENRTLKVILSSNGHSASYYDEKVTSFIEIPEGSTSVDAIIDVPQRRQWNVMHVQFFEDGDPLKNYEASFNPVRTNYRNAGDDMASVLVIDSDAPTRDKYRSYMATITTPSSDIKDKRNLPDVRWLVAAIPSNLVSGNNQNLFYVNNQFDDAQLLQTFASHDSVDIVPPEEFSTRWMSNSNADLTVISLDDLKLLKQQHPGRHEALLRWIRAGGSLMVYGCGDKWERLTSLSQLVDLPAAAGEPGGSSPWRLPQKSKFHDQVEGLLNNANGYPQAGGAGVSYTMPDGSVVTSSTPNPPPQLNWTVPPFTWRRCGLGAVVAYRSDNPFPGIPSDWGGLWNTLGSQQFLWTRRHGMSHHQENADFWNFVIPGVGEAPVFSFMTMIALFMLLIGPANYYYLNRWRRLSLLLVTVPLGAGIFTAGLFAFALLSDGFSTRARLRSYTVLEPDSGRAVSMSRQTYYTAFVPSDGMRYPSDTAVYPLHYSPSNEALSYSYFYQSDSQWVDDKLQLQRRYLTARQHRQFMVVRSTKSGAKLEVRSAGKALQVKNQLGSRLELAFLADNEGQLHRIEDLEPGATATAEPITSADAQKAWRSRLEPKAPLMPTNFDPTRFNSVFNRRGYYWGRNAGQWTPTQSSNLLERGINDINAWFNNAEGAERTYIAITADSIVAEDGEPLVPLGVRGSRVVESLHVLRGGW